MRNAALDVTNSVKDLLNHAAKAKDDRVEQRLREGVCTKKLSPAPHRFLSLDSPLITSRSYFERLESLTGTGAVPGSGVLQDDSPVSICQYSQFYDP